MVSRELREHDANPMVNVVVDIEEGVSFGFPDPRETFLEAPCQVRRGIYDVDLIGAFTYLGGREAHQLFEGAFDWPQLTEFREQNRTTVERAAALCGDYLNERFGKIEIGNDVWIGEGAFIRRGVRIGDGAIVAARSVVVADVPSYAIVAGSPARVVRYRFDEATREALLELSWWRYGLSALDGVDFTNVPAAIEHIRANIASGRAQPYTAPLVKVDALGRRSAWSYEQETSELVPYEA